MVYRYVPILRAKAGERTALQRLSPLGRADLTPLILLAPEQFVGKKATANRPAVPSPALFVQQIQLAWGVAPFFLDAAELPTATSGHPLAAIAHLARANGLSLIPATSLSVPPAYQAAVIAAAAIDGRGVALRIDLQDMSSAAGWVANWPIPLGETDLIIDLGAAVNVVQTLGSAVNVAFQNLHGGAAWRSVTLVGTSIPANFTGLASGVYTIPRAEVALWATLSALPLPYRLDFGDYATVSTATAPSGIAWGYPISVKYTLQSDFLICRGVRTTGLGAVDMDVQLIGHANSIVNYVARGALAHCWADSRINLIAAGTISPGGLPGWVGLSVNRHIECTRAHLP